jgi:hypothetical protein
VYWVIDSSAITFTINQTVTNTSRSSSAVNQAREKARHPISSKTKSRGCVTIKNLK